MSSNYKAGPAGALEMILSSASFEELTSNIYYLDKISESDPKECISCTSCIKACPQDARGFYGSLARATRIAREKLHFKRKDPEWFI